MTSKGRPKGTRLGPYRLLATMLYGQHVWLTREGGTVRAPISRLATHMRTRANRIQEYLYELEDMGLIDTMRWNPHWCTVYLRCPENMAVIRGDVIDV